MIEAAASLKGIVAIAPARPGEETTSPFSFAAAVSALETRAAQSLEVHGPAPAQNAVTKSPTTHANETAAAERFQRPGDAAVSKTDLSAQRTAQDTAALTQQTPTATTQSPSGGIASNVQQQAQLMSGQPAPPAQTQQIASSQPKADGAMLRASDTAKPEPLKTPGQTSAPQKAAPPTQDFAALLARRLNSGASHFELRLDPPELGRVEASLHIADDGEKILALKFENQSALDLFSRDEAALRNALSSSGFDIAREHVSFALAESESDPQSDAAVSPDAAYDSSFVAPWSAGAIDIHI